MSWIYCGFQMFPSLTTCRIQIVRSQPNHIIVFPWKDTFYFTSIERCSVVIIVIACSQGFRGLEFKTKQIILWNVVKDQEVIK